MTIAWIKAKFAGYAEIKGEWHRVTPFVDTRFRIEKAGSDISVVFDRDVHAQIDRSASATRLEGRVFTVKPDDGSHVFVSSMAISGSPYLTSDQFIELRRG